MNWVSFGSGNGLAPVQRQSITWTNADLLPIGSPGADFSEIQIKIVNTQLFIHKNAFKYVVCEMGAILSRERWVKLYVISSVYYWMYFYINSLWPSDAIWHQKLLITGSDDGLLLTHVITWSSDWLNSLYPQRYGGKFECVILQHILMIDTSRVFPVKLPTGWWSHYWFR